MRILKIGRSSSNDIVVNDPTASSQHAAITIPDTGEVRIKDLNSKNGTFVNDQRIVQETLITEKDVVKAGNSIVDWQKHLNAPKPVRQFPVIEGDAAAIKQKKTIGRNLANDIVVAYNEVSGSHAQLLQKVSGDIVIADSGSTNGTYVNGNKISTHVLRPGDAVLLANKYPLNWNTVFSEAVAVQPPSFENNIKPKNNKTRTLLIAAAVIVVVVVIGYFAFQNPQGVQNPAMASSKNALSPEQIYAMYKKSVVLIVGSYYFQSSVNGQDLGYYGLDNRGELVAIESVDEAINYSGTGFIISNDGKIVTNKHVAYPWDYDSGYMAAIKEYEQKRLAGNSRTRHLAGEVKVEGKLVYIGCFLNDTHVSGLPDLINCTSLKAGATNDVDVAIIQINTKTLPAGVERIVDLNQAAITDDALVVGSSVYTIGFPAGFDLAQTAQGLAANNQDGKITQLRGDVEFGHNIAIQHGASGSPVFNQYGQLVGVVNAGFLGIGDSYNMAIKAKYAVELAK